MGVALVEPWWSFGGALGWLWSRNPLAISWLWGRIGVALVEPWGGFTVALLSHCPPNPLPIPSQAHGSYVALIWLWVACPGFSRFEVGSSKFGVHHKNSKYNPTIPPPSGWSGGTLVPPWTYPIPIERPKGAIFNQARLSRSLSCGSSTMKRASKFDVQCSMFGP